MSTVLVTGGAGFFGSVLLQRLLDDGFECVSLDLQPHGMTNPMLRTVQGDVRNEHLLERLCTEYRFDAVFHCAAILAHAVKDKGFLWSSNVDGARVLGRVLSAHGVPKLVFISSNCLWGEAIHRPVTEDDEPRPVEIYGRSKWEAEKILLARAGDLDVTVLRSPTIMGDGRLGLVSILFDFIREGRRVWVVGEGDNRYQFVAARELAGACILALAHPGSEIYNVGSDNVRPLREVYEHVIAQAGTGARVASLPLRPTLAVMGLAGALGISPLGPYHRRMIAEDFAFDTSKVKADLGWHPTLTNEDMLAEAYKGYERDYREIQSRTDVSAHRQPAPMGAIRILKWLS
ncbi:MAG: NAD-dependent epimerase/dehydratase family protein [Actinobacteria bacterium]|nr:NAD-dependent epimerase/dehydratase family protein [Actinomycetota bacterium]